MCDGVWHGACAAGGARRLCWEWVYASNGTQRSVDEHANHGQAIIDRRDSTQANPNSPESLAPIEEAAERRGIARVRLQYAYSTPTIGHAGHALDLSDGKTQTVPFRMWQGTVGDDA